MDVEAQVSKNSALRQGAVNSSESLSLQEALDDPNLNWVSTNTFRGMPWIGQREETFDGVDAAECGPVHAPESGAVSELQTTVKGPGIMSFRWKLETSNAFLLRFAGEIVPGGASTNILSKAMHWEQHIVRIGEGERTLIWQFIDRGGEGHPPGAAWLDQVRYTPDTDLRTVGLFAKEALADRIQMEIIGPVGMRVGLESTSDLRTWSTNGLPTVLLSTGRDVVEVQREGEVRFYRAGAYP